MFDLVVRNGTVVTAADVTRCDIGIRDGRIVTLGEGLPAGRTEVDATGLYLLPGGIDSHVHLAHARDLIASWTTDCNTARPHSALGYQTPAGFALHLTTATARPAARDESSARRAIAQPVITGLRSRLDERLVEGRAAHNLSMRFQRLTDVPFSSVRRPRDMEMVECSRDVPCRIELDLWANPARFRITVCRSRIGKRRAGQFGRVPPRLKKPVFPRRHLSD